MELAVSNEEPQKGLMFRVSLDMIFIRGDGRIQRIAEDTETGSDRIISSGRPVRAVLEVVAGTAKKFGIAPGDRVASLIFRR